MMRIDDPVLQPVKATVRSRRFWPFALWLAVFYTSWLALVIAGDHWRTLAEHWGIAVAMAAGSYVAGSTPMGGGTVGFPILVLLFGEPPVIGRNFAFAIQSIGMVSASIFLLCRRQAIEWPMLRAALLGSLAGTPLGVFFLAPHVDDLAVKLLFAVVWASFGVMHLVKGREICRAHGMKPATVRFDTVTGLVIGLTGGAAIASITGVGIDMLIYTVLVLVSRADVKIAIPTSVILMAFTSLVGIASNAILASVAPEKHAIDPEVYANWLAAAPVVAIGAPLGALIVSIIPRWPTLAFVSVLCVFQFGWTIVHEQVSGVPLAVALAGIVAFNALFHGLYRWGARRSPPNGQGRCDQVA